MQLDGWFSMLGRIFEEDLYHPSIKLDVFQGRHGHYEIVFRESEEVFLNGLKMNFVSTIHFPIWMGIQIESMGNAQLIPQDPAQFRGVLTAPAAEVDD